MDYTTQIAEAKEKFGKLLEEQLKRVEDMKAQGGFLDYAALDTIKIGVCGGDGIGPAITAQAQRILEYLLADEVKSGKVEFKVIDGLTIERRVAENCEAMWESPTAQRERNPPAMRATQEIQV